MNDARSELQRQHTESQRKYTYFMIAVSGACISCAIEKGIGVPLSWYLSLLALAVFFWASSFYCGCKCITTVQSLIGANAKLLDLSAGNHESQPDQPELLAAAIRCVRIAIAENMKQAKLQNDWQSRLFLMGGVFFVGWRVTEIIRLAPLQ